MNIRKTGFAPVDEQSGARPALRTTRCLVIFLCTIMIDLVLYGCTQEKPESSVSTQNTPDTAVGAPQHAPRSPEDEARLIEAMTAVRSNTLSLKQLQALSDVLKGDLLSMFAARNEPDAVHRLIEQGIAPDTRDSAGNTALAAAVFSDSLAAARALIASGARPQAEVDNVTVVELARLSGSAEMIALVASGKPLDAGAYLRRAARANDSAEVRRLLARGVNPNATDTGGFTPLIEATASGAIEAMALLIEADAKLDAATTDGLTPAIAAIMAGHVKALDLLLGAGLNPKTTSRGVPLLTLAIMSGQTDLVDLLLKKGADPEQKSDDGGRPAAIAKALGHDELSKRLGGTPELTTVPDLPAAIRSGNAAAVRKALENGADPNQTLTGGAPVLFIASATANANVVHELLAGGANPFTRGPTWSTSIHAAFLNNDRHEAVAISTKLIAAARQREGNGGRTLLTARDDSGRSGLTRLVTATVGSDNLDSLVAELEHTDLREAASVVDRDGVSPYAAAVLTNNETFIKFFTGIGAAPTTGRAGETLQELARARKAWAALAALPDDRPIPRGLKKGASREVKKEMQQLLKEWGYYEGAIDGVFGAGSSAAMKQFLLDRRQELLKMAEYNPSIQVGKYSGTGNNNEVTLSVSYKVDRCSWDITDWYVKPGKSESDQFVGCITGGKNWNSNGVAYVHYKNGNEEIVLLGENGWKDAVPLE